MSSEHQSPRYAIYLAPKPQSALWQFGSTVLGYDAETGLDRAGFRLPSMPEDRWFRATLRARTYGFHATLKAPFRLADAYDETQLIDELIAFAKTQNSLPSIQLELAVLDEKTEGGFLALVQTEHFAELEILEAATVEGLDHLRAPLSKDEYAKRNPESLSKRQVSNLKTFGYPFVLEDFRLHFTLSDRLQNAATIKNELDELMLGHVGSAHIEIDELVLFKQPADGSRFRIIARVPLGEQKS